MVSQSRPRHAVTRAISPKKSPGERRQCPASADVCGALEQHEEPRPVALLGQRLPGRKVDLVHELSDRASSLFGNVKERYVRDRLDLRSYWAAARVYGRLHLHPREAVLRQPGDPDQEVASRRLQREVEGRPIADRRRRTRCIKAARRRGPTLTSAMNPGVSLSTVSSSASWRAASSTSPAPSLPGCRTRPCGNARASTTSTGCRRSR